MVAASSETDRGHEGPVKTHAVSSQVGSVPFVTADGRLRSEFYALLPDQLPCVFTGLGMSLIVRPLGRKTCPGGPRKRGGTMDGEF
ncbi:hypothetical protein CSOJ01_13664 [Colletotrichum sojae]|uniref:Uncharacterized protein n=1 Tax=Colletotrichum sojae TaxID=2175907 RepID=A0A8H6IS75_9PEZI|nr:hypothetical protein CSOJ01_13664 [Colletotrichum sojae]